MDVPRLERGTSSMSTMRSNQLSYTSSTTSTLTLTVRLCQDNLRFCSNSKFTPEKGFGVKSSLYLGTSMPKIRLQAKKVTKWMDSPVIISFYDLKVAKALSWFPNAGQSLAKPAVGTRTYGWLHWCRRLNLDYERLPASSVRAASRNEAFIHIAMIRIMLRRLAWLFYTLRVSKHPLTSVRSTIPV